MADQSDNDLSGSERELIRKTRPDSKISIDDLEHAYPVVTHKH